jgi:hypothetical protein
LPGLGVPLMNSNPIRDENDVLLRDDLIIKFILEESKTREEIMKCRQEESLLNTNVIESNGNIIMTGGTMIGGSLLGGSSCSILSKPSSTTSTTNKKPFNLLDDDNDDFIEIKPKLIKSKCWTDKMITDDIIIRSMLKLIQKQIDVQEENDFFGEPT